MWEITIADCLEEKNMEVLELVKKVEDKKESVHRDMEMKGKLEIDVLKAINRLDADHLHYFIDLFLYSPLLLE